MRRTCIAVTIMVAGRAGSPSGLGGELPLADARDDDSGSLPVDGFDDTPRPPTPDLIQLCGAVPLSLEDWERCYKNRRCEILVGCVSQSEYRDVQQCLDRSDDVAGGRLEAERHERARAVARGRASINLPAFAQCLADTSEDLCNTVSSSVTCATRFTGTVADGEACFTDIECGSPGAICEASCSEACCPGTCRPKFRENEACDLFASCEPGLRCNRICRSGDIGTPCESNSDCDASAWCDAGRCSADLAPGAACTSLLQCGGQTSCVGLAIVGSDPGQCLRTAKAGDRCDDSCYGNLYCDDSGICRELPQLGQSCSAFVLCGSVDLMCRDGVCAARDGVGTSCSATRTCQRRLFCTSELGDPGAVCAAPRAAGQRCTAPRHCDSYLCSGTTGQPGVCLTPSDSCAIRQDRI